MNWYLNNYARFMRDQIHWNTDHRVPVAGISTGRAFTGAGNTISARAQVVF